MSWKIYGLIDPRNHRLYYIGKTARVLEERMDEHFFDSGNTQVAKKNHAIIQSGQQPHILLLEEGIEDEAVAFHKELHWIHYWTSQGKPLRNREAQHWFRERYDDAFSGTRSRPAAKANAQAIPALQANTYARVQALCPTLDHDDITELEIAWRTWLATPGKTPPKKPDAAFTAFCQKKLEGKS